MTATSEARIEANRKNARKSTGPRSFAAKHVSARNALKHGLSSLPVVPVEAYGAIEQLAWMICGEDADKELLAVGRRLAREMVRLVEYRRARHLHLLTTVHTYAAKHGITDFDSCRTDPEHSTRSKNLTVRLHLDRLDELVRLDLYDRRNRRFLKKATRAFLVSLTDLACSRTETAILDARFEQALASWDECEAPPANRGLPRRPSSRPPRPSKPKRSPKCEVRRAT